MPDSGPGRGLQPSVPAEVAAVEYLGADSLIDARLDGQAVLAKVAGKAKFQRGERIGLAWAAADCHWFDAESGDRLQ